jgi:Glycosyltransferases involved in cell wall biogenesis
MVKVSVIIPVYNEEQYLEQCLDSVCGQTLEKIEIICVDDGSADRSPQILAEYAGKDSRIKVLTQKNRFAGTARNHGMKYAVGEYLSFLDADDYFAPDMLEKMYQRAEEYGADVTVCSYVEYNEERKEICEVNREFEELFFRRKDVFSGRDLNCAGIFQITKGWAWDKLFRADFVRRSGYEFPDFRSSEDGFFVYMLLAGAERISYMDDVFITHRVNVQGSLSDSKDKDWMSGLKMWLMIGRELKGRGMYPVYEQSFLNELVYFLSWYLESMHNPESAENCRDAVRKMIEPEFGILSYGEEFFWGDGLSDWYRNLIHSEREK